MKENRTTFLNEVMNQIKSKEAQKYVVDELDYHLMEAKNEWLAKGASEDEAEQKAIAQMGNPIKLGQQLNKLHRPKMDWWMVILLITTFGLGFLPLFSVKGLDSSHFIINKIFIVLFGVVIAIGITLLDYRRWKKYGWLFYSIGILMLLALILIPTYYINGSPIIKIAPISIQSLMVIPIFYLAWASFFDSERFKIWQFFLLFALSFLLFLSVSELSTTYIYLIMVVVMLCWSKFSRKAIWTIIGLGTSAFIMFGVIVVKTAKTYQLVRLYAFLNPEKYADGAGFMILRVKEVMAKAGWLGNPLDRDMIPDAQTDLVFVGLTYHYGWIFAVVLFFILSLFIARIIIVISKIKDTFGRMLLIGALALYGVQFGTNILMILGFFPMTGMSLPFISYGLMPVLLNAFLMGIVLSVYRIKDLVSSRIV